MKRSRRSAARASQEDQVRARREGVMRLGGPFPMFVSRCSRPQEPLSRGRRTRNIKTRAPELSFRLRKSKQLSATVRSLYRLLLGDESHLHALSALRRLGLEHAGNANCGRRAHSPRVSTLPRFPLDGARRPVPRRSPPWRFGCEPPLDDVLTGVELKLGLLINPAE